MAINVLKKSKTEIEKAAEDAKVREVVEATLGEIEKNGDVAVRELSKKFDNNAPDKFKLTNFVPRIVISAITLCNSLLIIIFFFFIFDKFFISFIM